LHDAYTSPFTAELPQLWRTRIPTNHFIQLLKKKPNWCRKTGMGKVMEIDVC